MSEAYPLQWPAGRTRTAPDRRKPASFHATSKRQSSVGSGLVSYRRDRTIAEARDALFRELRMLGAKPPIVVSSNLRLNLDGSLRSGQPEPGDPGAAVYFKFNGQETAFACDRWDRSADNIYAIAKTIEAIRGIARWGSGEMVRAAFTGFRALPPPVRPWRQVFGFSADERPLLDEVERRHRAAASQHHPDRGGLDPVMAELNAARDSARQELA